MKVKIMSSFYTFYVCQRNVKFMSFDVGSGTYVMEDLEVVGKVNENEKILEIYIQQDPTDSKGRVPHVPTEDDNFASSIMNFLAKGGIIGIKPVSNVSSTSSDYENWDIISDPQPLEIQEIKMGSGIIIK